MAELVKGMDKFRAIQKIAKSGLGASLLPLFRYAKIKGDVLFLVFKHEAGSFEFRFQKEQIKSKMRGFYSLFKAEMKEHGIVFKDIEAVVIAEPKEVVAKQKDIRFDERSRGFFDNRATGSLAVLFEDIQKTIKEKA